MRAPPDKVPTIVQGNMVVLVAEQHWYDEPYAAGEGAGCYLREHGGGDSSDGGGSTLVLLAVRI